MNFALRRRLDVFVSVLVPGAFDVDGDQVNRAVSDSTLRKQFIGVRLNIPCFAPQKYRFDAVIVVKMCVHCGDGQVVVLVLQVVYPLGEFALVMVVDETDAGDAIKGSGLRHALCHDVLAQNVAYGLRSVFVSMLMDQDIEFFSQRFIQRNGDSFHHMIPVDWINRL